MTDYYAESLIRQIIAKPAFLYSGVRKIVQDITWEPPVNPDRFSLAIIPGLTYSDIGYGPNKHGLLQKTYFNEAEAERVRGLLDRRKGQSFNAIAMSMRGREKDSRSQGHCMQSLIISQKRDFEVVEIQYRSTEVIFKFGGDLIFLPWVFEQLGLNPNVVRFRFANAYLSGVFFPTLCANGWDPVDFLQQLSVDDPKLFAGGTRFFLRSAYKRDQHFPYSPENQQHKFAWKHLDMDRIRRFLEKKHKQLGKPLPKMHHRKEEYIPRGKRA